MAKKEFTMSVDVLNVLTPSNNGLTMDVKDLKDTTIELVDILNRDEEEESDLNDESNKNNEGVNFLFKSSNHKMVRMNIRSFINQDIIVEGSTTKTEKMYSRLSEKKDDNGTIKIPSEITIKNAVVRRNAADTEDMYPAASYKVFQSALELEIAKDPHFEFGKMYDKRAVIDQCTGDNPSLLVPNARPYKKLTFSI